VRELTAMPRWFWLLPVMAMAVWWPIDAYWASDDFIAVAYSQNLGDAASDLVGRQYGATDIWAFYRPLITLSFWFDQMVGGAFPPFGHCSNVLAHAASTLLVALLWRRFLSNGSAFGAAFLWAMMPGHIGSIAWGVGRVDSHTTVWCLMALWLCLRANEQRAAGQKAASWPMLVATACALMSKELAFVVPPLCSWLTLMQLSRGEGAGHSLLQRVRATVQATWPVWLLFALYLPFRILVLGKFGGYDAGSLPPEYGFGDFLIDIGAKVEGLGRILLDELLPLRWIGAPGGDSAIPTWLFLFGAGAPVAAALVYAIVRRPRMVIMTLLAFTVAMAPMVTFWTADSPHNLRYYYLPSIAFAGLLASAGRWFVLVIVLAWLSPFVAVRSVQHQADQQSATMHEAMLQRAETVPEGPMFVAGLPHMNKAKTSIQLHFGVDRMLRPPFSGANVPLYALRPLSTAPKTFRLGKPGTAPFALPAGSTWWFDDLGLLVPAAAPKELPELVMTGDEDGVVDFGFDRLTELAEQYDEIKATGRDSFGLNFPGVKGPFFRMTVFTANGYLCCICQNHAKPQESHGRLDIVRILAEDLDRPFDIARFAFGKFFLANALPVPTTIDLVPEFPTLIEAGMFDMATQAFTPSHRARRLVRFRFDRRYAEWVRTVQGR
jgi:hypothetical protein